jgi:hypothetical protein
VIGHLTNLDEAADLAAHFVADRRYGEMAAVIGTTSWRVSTSHTQPMRRMFVSRSSLKAEPLAQVLTDHVAVENLRAQAALLQTFSTWLASVDLPAPDSP